ncbi:MAG TPA: hypothetical protein VHR45_19995 [Thermoanaerobaculia bacterium]|nr:hypothetical protein [Thermoanaerobaculia bacterium]
MPESKTTTLAISRAAVAFIERRGGRSNRGGGEFSRAAVVQRTLMAYGALLQRCDPRKTSGLSEEMFRLAVALLEEPWSLRPLEVEHLGETLGQSAGLEAAAKEAKVDREEFVKTIEALGFAEKMAIVDASIQDQAPRAAGTIPEEF